MADLNFQNRLQHYGRSLSKSERRIADFISARPEDAASLSSLALAKMIGTSNSTLTRFCQKLQYRNYIELQTLLGKEHTPEEAPSEPVRKVNFYYQKLLCSSMELIQISALQAFVKRLREANKVLIVGLGSSGLMAKELNLRLVQMGFTSTAITDSHLMLLQSSLFSAKSLIVAISASGETREVIDACQAAKRVHIPICALTQSNQTALTNLADTILFTSDLKQVSDGRFVHSQLPLLFLIDALTYLLLEDSRCEENLKKARQALANR